jgi:hypothetical protein
MLNVRYAVFLSHSNNFRAGFSFSTQSLPSPFSYSCLRWSQLTEVFRLSSRTITAHHRTSFTTSDTSTELQLTLALRQRTPTHSPPNTAQPTQHESNSNRKEAKPFSQSHSPTPTYNPVTGRDTDDRTCSSTTLCGRQKDARRRFRTTLRSFVLART